LRRGSAIALPTNQANSPGLRGGRIIISVHLANSEDLKRAQDILKRSGTEDNRKPERSVNDKTVMKIL
jgi:hypothetical protein